MAFSQIRQMLDDLLTGPRHFPPTTLYNEGWLLRLVMDWFARHDPAEHALRMLPGTMWYSEALLPSAFIARALGDRLAEKHTHADGVFGHFDIGKRGKADLSLHADARQFVVLEAKLSSRLSGSTRNAPGYDQAARNVACMAETLCRAECSPDQFASLGFYVLAPQEKITKGRLTAALEKDSIREKVQKRVDAYAGEKADWFAQSFLPLMDRVEVQAISWETLIAFIGNHDAPAAEAINTFYGHCLDFN